MAVDIDEGIEAKTVVELIEFLQEVERQKPGTRTSTYEHTGINVHYEEKEGYSVGHTIVVS